MREVLKKIDELANELQQKLNEANSVLTQNKNRETELAGLIEENKLRSTTLNEKEEALLALEKKINLTIDVEAAAKKNDEDLKELRRLRSIFETSKQKSDEETQRLRKEAQDMKDKYHIELEALTDEKRSYKERMKQTIIDDFVKEKLKG